MASEYIDAEVAKIYSDKNFEFPQNLAMSCAWILGNFKALNIKAYDLRKENSLADYFVIATATNTIQASSMSDSIIVQAKKHGNTVYSKEGLRESDWLLIDIGDIIVHIFVGPARENYDLDALFRTCPTLDIPAEYYFSAPESANDSGTKGYF